MWPTIKTVFLNPMRARLGTATAAFLVFGGDWLCANWNACGLVTPSGADMVATYVIAAGFLALDLVAEALARNKGKR